MIWANCFFSFKMSFLLRKVGQTPVEYSYGLVMASVDKPHFAFVFQQHLIFIVCVLGILRSKFIAHEKAFAEMDHICDMLVVLKTRIFSSATLLSRPVHEDIEAAFLQMSEGLVSVRLSLEVSLRHEQEEAVEEHMRSEHAVVMMVLNYNCEKEEAEQHAQELLDMLEADKKLSVADGAGAKRRDRNGRRHALGAAREREQGRRAAAHHGLDPGPAHAAGD